MFPGKLKTFFSNFPKLHDSVKVLMERLTFEENVKLVEKYSLPTTNIEAKNYILARLMTSLVPTVAKITQVWKPTLAEAHKGFILRALVIMLIFLSKVFAYAFRCYCCAMPA